MDFLKNEHTQTNIFYHASREGIVGNIQPKSRKRVDFGEGFYIGTKKDQTVALVSQNKSPKLYEIKIQDDMLNDENTLHLSNEDWMYFVLYNRGKLEDIRETQLYNYYAHLSDGKDYIVGPIADDAYEMCLKDFCKNNITDKMFLELINNLDYGTQIVCKSQKACDNLTIVAEHEITVKEKRFVAPNYRLSREERETKYQLQKSLYQNPREGQYLATLKELAKTNDFVFLQNPIFDEKYRNIQFDNLLR